MLGFTILRTQVLDGIKAEKKAADANLEFTTAALKQLELADIRNKGTIAEYESSVTVLIDRLEKAHHDRIDVLNSVEKLRAINENTSRDLNALRSVAARQHGVLEALLPIVEEYLEGESDEDEGLYAGPAIALREILHGLKNNALINAREGNKAQAARERKAAKSVTEAISALEHGEKHG